MLQGALPYDVGYVGRRSALEEILECGRIVCVRETLDGALRPRDDKSHNEIGTGSRSQSNLEPFLTRPSRNIWRYLESSHENHDEPP